MKTLLTKPLALILFLFFLGLSPEAPADTQYSYTGNDFTSWTNTACPPACHITGSLTLATPLLTGLNFADVTPLSYSFTDGITTWSDVNAPGGIFEFSTDAMGNITFWIGSLAKTQDPSQCDPGSADLRFLQFESTTTFASNFADAICATDTAFTTLYEAENNSSGMWTVSTTGGAPVPEPGTLLLLGVSITGMLGLRRRRNVGAVVARISILGIAFLCLLRPAAAQNTWMSAGHPVPFWTNQGAWSLNMVPDGSTDILIPDGTVNGDKTFTNGNTLTIGAPATLTILSPTTIANARSSATIDNFGTLVNNGVLINELGATLNNNSTGTLINNGTISNQLMGSMSNAGFLQNMSGGLVTNDLSSAITNSGTWVNYSGSTLTNSGTMSSTNLLQTLSGGTLDNFGMLSQTGMALLDNQGTLNNSGTLSADNMENHGIMNNNAGTMTISVGLNSGTGVTLTNFAGAHLDAVIQVIFDSGATLNNYGLLTTEGHLQTFAGGTINNFGTLIKTDGSILDNQGTLNNNGSLSANDMENHGIMNNNAGTMTISNGVNSSAGATLTNFAGAQLDVTGQLINDLGGILNNYGLLTSEGHLQTFAEGTINNFGTIQSGRNVYLDNQGTLNNSGTITAGLFFNSGTTTNSGAMTINPGVTFSQNLGVFNNQPSGQLANNTDLVNFAGATLNNSGTFTNNNLFENQAGSTLSNTGVLNNVGTFQNRQGATFALQSGGALNNSGTFISEFQSTFQTAAGSAILNTGTMSLATNTFIEGSLRNNGTITMVAPPPTGVIPIQMPPPPLIVSSTGTLSGTGTVNSGPFGSFSASVIMQGVMSPGDPVGTFTIDGTYTQTDTGMLEILLGGTGVGQFGQLDVLQSATVSGTLDVELFAGFDPQAGEVFEILESGGFSSFDFLSLLFPTLPDGLFFKLDQEGGNLFLDVMQGEGGGGTPTPEPGTGMLLLGTIAAMFCASLLRKRLPAPGA
jgi:hypothetical protein